MPPLDQVRAMKAKGVVHARYRNVDTPDDVICQFGKVGEDKFHLDFKAPISPFQAFGIALTQFNI